MIYRKKEKKILKNPTPQGIGDRIVTEEELQSWDNTQTATYSTTVNQHSSIESGL